MLAARTCALVLRSAKAQALRIESLGVTQVERRWWHGRVGTAEAMNLEAFSSAREGPRPGYEHNIYIGAPRRIWREVQISQTFLVVSRNGPLSFFFKCI